MLSISLPVTSIFLEKGDHDTESSFFHFNLIINNKFDSICLKELSINPSLKYRHNWLTCFEPESHLDELSENIFAKYISKKNNHKEILSIFGYSFKDDTTLKRIGAIAKAKNTPINLKKSQNIGLPVDGACLHDLFKYTNLKNIKKIIKVNGKADILIIRHVLEHTWNIKLFLDVIKELVKDEGILVFEIPDSEKGLRKGLHSLLWEEHAHYLTEDSLKRIVELCNFKILDFIRYPNNLEDSLVIILKKNNNSKMILSNTSISSEILKEYISKFNLNKNKIKKEISSILRSGREIYLFGAGHHASSFVSINNIEKEITGVLDDNIHKQKYNLPGSKIPILSTNILSKDHQNINIFLTTNPENNSKIISLLKKKNKNLIIKSIFDFYN